ncbi:MAG: PQQ-dependent sugar dehydrogenase [Acidimicrobiia bacterium]
MRRTAHAVIATALLAAACSSSKHAATTSTSAHSTTTSTKTSTTGSRSTTSTTTRAPSIPAAGDLAQARVKLTELAPVERPTAFATRRGDSSLYVTEQAGRIRAIRAGRLDPTPVLDLRDTISSAGERGLLGLAFSPDGTKLYVDYTNLNGDTRVDEYEMRGTLASRATRRELLAIPQPQPNHNGGQLAFGPDGMLYVGMGDGGAADDQGPGHVAGGNAQSRDVLLGKILRVDPRRSATAPYTIPPDNPYAHGGGRPEVWAIGLRNPWRFSFDRQTHDLWIGDVGQNQWEEIDFAPGTSARGANFGWNRFEGTHPYRDPAVSGTIAPILEYPHDGRCSVTGGYVYRGSRIPALVGAYLYADYCGHDIRAFTQRDGKAVGDRALGIGAGNIASFGEDGDGELYVLSQGDGVLRIDPQ